MTFELKALELLCNKLIWIIPIIIKEPWFQYCVMKACCSIYKYIQNNMNILSNDINSRDVKIRQNPGIEYLFHFFSFFISKSFQSCPFFQTFFYAWKESDEITFSFPFVFKKAISTDTKERKNCTKCNVKFVLII